MPRPQAAAARGRSRTGSRADARREPVWPPRPLLSWDAWRVYARLFDRKGDRCVTRAAGEARNGGHAQPVLPGLERVARGRASREPECVAAGQEIAQRRERAEVVAFGVEQLQGELRERLNRVLAALQR